MNKKEFIAKLKKGAQVSAGRGTVPTGRCSPGYHSHPDKYGGKCHKIEQEHFGIGKPKDRSQKVKKLLKKIQQLKKV